MSANPGGLVHVAINKLNRDPDGGGWQVHGRTVGSRNARATTEHGRGSHQVI